MARKVMNKRLQVAVKTPRRPFSGPHGVFKGLPFLREIQTSHFSVDKENVREIRL